ncbi:CBN-CED-8 protein [Aphelenchoides avenae]|nr:CBN-CED-8 protein [Aphelenchus avenae]
MVEADRDASLLRFFECFLESMPQLMVQGFLVAQEFWAIHTSAEPRPIPTWMLYQIASISCSLLSACSAIVAQHRSLRISCPGKANMSVDECMFVLVWRASTLCARYVSLVLFMLAFKEWAVLVLVLHFLVSFGHIVAFQSIATDTSLAAMEVALLLINAAVHTFIPFNMAEGSTKRQYIAAYVIEFVENSILLALCMQRPSFDFPYKLHLSAFAVTSFAFGIGTMIVYYAYFHPNRRAQRLRSRQGRTEEVDGENRANAELEQALAVREPQAES